MTMCWTHERLCWDSSWFNSIPKRLCWDIFLIPRYSWDPVFGFMGTTPCTVLRFLVLYVYLKEAVLVFHLVYRYLQEAVLVFLLLLWYLYNRLCWDSSWFYGISKTLCWDSSWFYDFAKMLEVSWEAVILVYYRYFERLCWDPHFSSVSRRLVQNPPHLLLQFPDSLRESRTVEDTE
jgi:hypothetical protein